MADIEQNVPTVVTLAAELLELTDRACERGAEDPFGNPMLAVALAITRRVDHGHITLERLEELIRYLRDAAFADRATRLAAYVGGTDLAENEAALTRLAESLVRPDPDDSPVPLARFRTAVERTRLPTRPRFWPAWPKPRVGIRRRRTSRIGPAHRH
jgi:phosphoenolpyruvate carboxylase